VIAKNLFQNETGVRDGRIRAVVFLNRF